MKITAFILLGISLLMCVSFFIGVFICKREDAKVSEIILSFNPYALITFGMKFASLDEYVKSNHTQALRNIFYSSGIVGIIGILVLFSSDY